MLEIIPPLRHGRLRYNGEHLAQVLATLPGYSDAARAYDTARATLRDAQARSDPAAARAQLAVRVAQAVRKDEVLDLDALVQDAGATAGAITGADLLAQMLREVVIDAGSQLDTIIDAGQNTIFAFLAARLRETVTAARALDLADVTTAEAAIKAGRADAWMSFSKHAETITRLRGAQLAATDSFVDPTSDPSLRRHMSTFGAFRNIPDVWPAWRGTLAQGRPSTFEDQARTAAAPWPDDEISLLRWMVDHPEAGAWIPTPRQLRETYTTAHREAARAEADAAALTPDERAQRAQRGRAARTSDAQIRAGAPRAAAERADRQAAGF